jgi:hypothetical protein
MTKCTFTLSTLLLLAGCGGKGDGYAAVDDPPNQDVAFASDAVQSRSQHAEFASAAITGNCVEGCTGVCSEICKQACTVCPSALSCVGRVGAGSDCELGATICAAEHCPELFEDEDQLEAIRELARDRE